MKKNLIYMLAGTAMLFPINGNSAENASATPLPVKDPRDAFLPDINFSGRVYQVTSNPIIWNDDRSLASYLGGYGSQVACVIRSGA